DRPARTVDRAPDRLDLALVLVVRTADVVDLDEVDAPGRDELEDRVVVLLRAGLSHVDAVHVRVPGTNARAVGDVRGGNGRALHGQLSRDREPRHAPHQVDPELQALGVDVV